MDGPIIEVAAPDYKERTDVKRSVRANNETHEFGKTFMQLRPGQEKLARADDSDIGHSVADTKVCGRWASVSALDFGSIYRFSTTKPFQHGFVPTGIGARAQISLNNSWVVVRRKMESRSKGILAKLARCVVRRDYG